jgi:hypothetical protein
MKPILFLLFILPNYFLGQNSFPEYKDIPSWIIRKNESLYSTKIKDSFIGDTFICGKKHSIYKFYEKKH